MNPHTPKKFNFVRQTLSDEAFKELRCDLDPKGFYPAGNPRSWLVDEQHGLIFASLGGRGDSPVASDLMPNFYILLVGQLVIRFESRYTVKTVERKDSYLHEIFNTRCPTVLFEQRDYLQQAFREALFTDWGSRHDGKWITVADVDVEPFELAFT